jgi:glutathione S-transferase
MIFYFAIQTVSVASQIALEEAGADYELRRIDFKTTEQRSEEYLQINPKARVPALATDEGIITETPAILTYIAQAYPAAELAPLNDPFGFAKLQEFNNYLCSTVHVNHAHKMRGSRWVEEDDKDSQQAMTAKVPQTMTDSFNLIEKGLLAGPWVLGENFSVCDCYLFCISNWLAGDKVDINDFPRVLDHHLRMRERESVKKITAIHGI